MVCHKFKGFSSKKISAIIAVVFIIGGIAAAFTLSGCASDLGDSEGSDSSSPVETKPDVTTPAETEAAVKQGFVTILGEENDIATTNILNLVQKEITNEILREIVPEIKKLTNLNILGLWGNQITDIVPLTELTNLSNLYLENNQINESEIKALESKLPYCTINY